MTIKDSPRWILAEIGTETRAQLGEFNALAAGFWGGHDGNAQETPGICGYPLSYARVFAPSYQGLPISYLRPH